MYSVVLLAAMTAGGQATDWHCRSCAGSCYGSCYGNYGIDCGGYSGCWGGRHGCCGGYYGSSCGGSYGYGTCWGGYSCTGGYPWDWSTYGCHGCWGAYGETSPYFVQPAEPPVKTEVIPPPKKPGESLAPSKARLIVEAPDDAQLFIDDHAMTTPADRRTYQTPELEAGQTYYYEVRVEMERNGKTLSQTRRVLLHAGQEVRADFNDLTGTATAAK